MLLGLGTRPAQACAERPCIDYAPRVSADKSSVVVDEGQTATNTGTYEDPSIEEITAPPSAVTLSASVGSITKTGTTAGTWRWSYKTPNVSADETKTVTIIAKDSGAGADSSKSFSLTVKEGPPANDSFSSALDLATVHSGTTTDGTNLATMEPGEPRPYSPTKDCGITGVSNSAWFKFTYGSQGGLPPLLAPNAYYNFHTQGSNFDTVLALYEGSSLGTLKQIECSNNNSLPNWNDQLSIPQSKLSVGKTYYVQLTGTGGARSGKYQLRYEPLGLTQPKVMTYNINKGEQLPAVRDTIKALRPDIVLLNEVRNYDWNLDPFLYPPHGVWNQAQWLAEQTGFRYFKYHHTTLMGIHGTNGVAILSRYPITSTAYTPIYGENGSSHYGILKATIPIDGLTHHVFSTRFNDWIEWENRVGHETAIGQARLVPSTDAVIIGGDFNAKWAPDKRPWAKELWDRSGLTDAYSAAGILWTLDDPAWEINNRNDYIYYRGPYSVYRHRHGNSESLGLPPASDHGFVLTHFLRNY
jgi:endonuclease/exonuclease/phosphatase family metal-dependent hydrolase